MKRALLLLLAGCASLTPAEEAELRHRESRQLLAEGKDPAQALALLDQAVALNPGRAAFRTSRAIVHRLLKNPEAALADTSACIEILRRGPATGGDLASALLNRALLHGDAGRWAESEADFAEALRIVPQFVEVYLQRARFRRAAGRLEDADRDVAEARKVGAALANGFYNEGVRAMHQGDSPGAERMFQFALDLDPDHPHAHVAMGRIFMERHRFGDAVRVIGRAIARYPEDATLYYHRGNAHLAAGGGEEALADYSKAIELDATEAAYYAMRGLVHHRHGNDAAKATDDFNLAIRLDKDCHAAWLYRGLLMRDRNDLEAAEQDLRAALGIRATPEGTLALGRVLHERGEYAKAVDVYRKAMGLYRDPAVLKELGEELGRATRAMENPK